MFRCDLCKKVSKPGDRPTTIVTKRREKEYSNRSKKGKEIISKGWEIVEEKKCCSFCGEANELAKEEK